MKVIIALMVLAMLAAASILLPTAEQKRIESYQKTMRMALLVVESSLSEVSEEVGGAKVYVAELKRRSGGAIVSGAVSVGGIGEYKVHAPFEANLDWTCTSNTPRRECWRIAILNLGDDEGETTVVRNGEVVERLSAFSAIFMASRDPGGDGASAMSADMPGAETTQDLPDGVDSEARMSAGEVRMEEDPVNGDTVEPANAPTMDTKTDFESGTTSAATTTNLDADEIVIEIQRRLKILGYNIGAVDGVLGPKTTSAIFAYQRRHGLATDGAASAELLDHIQKTIDSRPDQTSQVTE